MNEIRVKKLEARWVRFTVTNGGVAYNLTGTTLKFGVKKNISDAAYLISKADGVFDKANQATGIVRVDLTTTDLTMTPGKYIAELKIIISGTTDVFKSLTIPFIVEGSVLHD